MLKRMLAFVEGIDSESKDELIINNNMLYTDKSHMFVSVIDALTTKITTKMQQLRFIFFLFLNCTF